MATCQNHFEDPELRSTSSRQEHLDRSRNRTRILVSDVIQSGVIDTEAWVAVELLDKYYIARPW